MLPWPIPLITGMQGYPFCDHGAGYERLGSYVGKLCMSKYKQILDYGVMCVGIREDSFGDWRESCPGPVFWRK
jgi:hypothetical protein